MHPTDTILAIAIRTTALTALGTAIVVIQGCSSVGHLLSAATTSPGEKTCSFSLTIENSPSSSDTSEIRTYSGFAGHEKELLSNVKKIYYPAVKRTVWQLRGNTYFSQVTPCVSITSLSVSLKSADGEWQAVIPNSDISSKPVFGNYYLSIDGKKVRLSLAENGGVTKYSAPAMTMVWATEPLRQVAEADLILSKQ